MVKQKSVVSSEEDPNKKLDSILDAVKELTKTIAEQNKKLEENTTASTRWFRAGRFGQAN